MMGIVNCYCCSHSLVFTGNIVRQSDKQHSLAGVLRYGTESYDVTGNMAMYNELPAAMRLELVPLSGGEKIMAHYTVQPQESGCAVRSQLRRGDTFATLEAHVTIRHKFDWDLHVQVRQIDGYMTKTRCSNSGMNQYD